MELTEEQIKAWVDKWMETAPERSGEWYERGLFIYQHGKREDHED